MATSEHHQDTVPLAELWIASVEKSGFSDETRNLQLGSSENINLPCLTLLCPDLLCKGCKRVPPTTHLPSLQHPSPLAGVPGDDTWNTGYWAHIKVIGAGSGFQEQWICAAPVNITWMLDAEKGEAEAVKWLHSSLTGTSSHRSEGKPRKRWMVGWIDRGALVWAGPAAGVAVPWADWGLAVEPLFLWRTPNGSEVLSEPHQPLLTGFKVRWENTTQLKGKDRRKTLSSLYNHTTFVTIKVRAKSCHLTTSHSGKCSGTDIFHWLPIAGTRERFQHHVCTAAPPTNAAAVMEDCHDAKQQGHTICPRALRKAKALQILQREAQNCSQFIRLCLRGFLPILTTNKLRVLCMQYRKVKGKVYQKPFVNMLRQFISVFKTHQISCVLSHLKQERWKRSVNTAASFSA